MGYAFPSVEWLKALEGTLNADAHYADVARKWEGALLFVIDPDAPDGGEPLTMYMDLWHGTCRGTAVLGPGEAREARFTLRAPLANFVKVLRGELDPMQAMLTRRLRVEGDMSYMMRNVPVVLDFVRCARSVPIADGDPATGEAP